MVQITVALPEDRLQELQEVAARLGVSVDTLVRVSVEELLAKPDESFRNTLDYALKKNEALYRRLA
ncbi:MAG: ribbon-helix-helix protein, CopG family [Terriglobia bacterium]